MRLVSLLCVAFTCGCIAVFALHAGQPDEGVEADPGGETIYERAMLVEDYSELTDLAGDEIVQVEVVFYEDDKVILNYGLVGENRLTFRSDEKHRLLHHMLKCSLPAPLHKVARTGTVGGSRPSARVGKVMIRTKRGSEFMVGINGAGFSLNSEQPDIRRNFYSWELAKILDDILFKERRLHIPYDLMARLSGADILRDAREVYFMAPRRWRVFCFNGFGTRAGSS